MADQPSSAHAIPPELAPRLTQFAMDNASIAIYWVGPDARIHYANHHACEMLGYGKDEIVGLSIPDLDPNYPMARWQDHWQSLKRDMTQSFETQHRCKGGKLIDVWVVANYVALDHHEYNVGFARDITDRKRIEATLLENEEFFRLISENVDDFIAVLDLEGRRLYNNRAYASLFGDYEALKGTDSFQEVHPEDRERIRLLFKKTVLSGVGHRAEFRFVLPDGSIRYMESSGSLVRNSRGDPMRVVVISHDVTERKLAETEIHDLAFQDALTKLPNRRVLRDRLEQIMAMTHRSHLYNALMFLDLDNFKSLNDVYGHDAGDQLLVEVSSRLKTCIREMDTAARFGGDEFMVLLDELGANEQVSRERAARVADKIRSALAAPYRLTVRHNEDAEQAITHRCTPSIGVALFNGHDATADEIIIRADKAMYLSKAAGGNQFQFYRAAD